MFTNLSMYSCRVSPPSPPSPPIKRTPIPMLHKRTLSYSGKSVFEEQSILRAMELDLAKQTRRLQKLRFVCVCVHTCLISVGVH